MNYRTATNMKLQHDSEDLGLELLDLDVEILQHMNAKPSPIQVIYGPYTDDMHGWAEVQKDLDYRKETLTKLLKKVEIEINRRQKLFATYQRIRNQEVMPANVVVLEEVWMKRFHADKNYVQAG